MAQLPSIFHGNVSPAKIWDQGKIIQTDWISRIAKICLQLQFHCNWYLHCRKIHENTMLSLNSHLKNTFQQKIISILFIAELFFHWRVFYIFNSLGYTQWIPWVPKVIFFLYPHSPSISLYYRRGESTAISRLYNFQEYIDYCTCFRFWHVSLGEFLHMRNCLRHWWMFTFFTVNWRLQDPPLLLASQHLPLTANWGTWCYDFRIIFTKNLQ